MTTIVDLIRRELLPETPRVPQAEGELFAQDSIRAECIQAVMRQRSGGFVESEGR